MKLLTVFHPTPFCNLACTYCWAPGKDDTAKMPLGIFEQTLRQVFSERALSRVDVCWLTGEPLVMGLDYYRKAVSICNSLKPNSVNLRFIVQTNGTLINEEWASFFAENDFTVGVSIDGPKAVHDGQRPNKSGKSTFDLTSRGIDYLVKHGVKGGALCVITRKTLEILPDDLFFFFHNRHLSWSYLLEARVGENAASEYALSPADLPRLREFLSRLIDLWAEYPGDYIKDFDQLSRRLFGPAISEIDFNNQGCLDIVNISANGDFFWGNPELMTASQTTLREITGNISSIDVWTFRETSAFRDFEAATHQGIEKCVSECPYFVGCRGGNPAHKYYQHGRFDVSSHLTCELNDKVIADLLLQRVEQGLDQMHIPT